MVEKFDLKEIRRNVYLIYSEDGLADLAVGLMIFGFGIFLALDIPAMIGLLGLIPFLVWYLGKESLVVPRVGSIKPNRETKRRFEEYFATLALIGVILLALYHYREPGVIGEMQSPLMIFGVVVGAGIATLGLALKAFRFHRGKDR